MLKLKVYNAGKMMKNELLGEADIALSSIDLTRTDMFHIDMFLQRSQVSIPRICNNH